MKSRQGVFMELEELRQEISKADDEMAALFVRRMNAARQIAEHKRERGLPVEDAEQEKRVIREHSKWIEDPDLRDYYVRFLQAVMDVSKSWQHRLLEGQKIAYCGTEGSDDHTAVKNVFPSGVYVGYETYDQAYEAVACGECDTAVLPFENAQGGEVGRVLDLIFSGDLFVNDVFNVGDDALSARYAVLSRTERTDEQGKSNRAFMLMFTVRDETGGLAKAINVISAYDFNMRVMRSRPMRDLPWNYYFYAEAIGDDTSDNGQRMLNAMRVVCPSVKVAGRYSL